MFAGTPYLARSLHGERVKQNRSKMGDERQDQEVGENRVRSPQHRVQHDAVRQDGGEDAPTHTVRSDSEPPTDHSSPSPLRVAEPQESKLRLSFGYTLFQRPVTSERIRLLNSA